MKEMEINPYKHDALRIIYEHQLVISEYEKSQKCALITVRNIIKETLEEYTNDENHDRVIHYGKVSEEIVKLEKVYFISTPILSENHFINKVGCLRYSYDEGRQSSVIEPMQIGECLEEEKHTITHKFICHNKKIVVIERKN